MTKSSSLYVVHAAGKTHTPAPVGPVCGCAEDWPAHRNTVRRPRPSLHCTTAPTLVALSPDIHTLAISDHRSINIKNTQMYLVADLSMCVFGQCASLRALWSVSVTHETHVCISSISCNIKLKIKQKQKGIDHGVDYIFTFVLPYSPPS